MAKSKNAMLIFKNTYQIALQHMDKNAWTGCAQSTIEIVSDTSINYIRNERKMRRWHIQFKSGEQFIVPINLFLLPEARMEIETFCPRSKSWFAFPQNL